jgi:propanol-preferring alcohol dehydrogenase
MVLSKCAPIETNPLKLLEIDRHEIKKENEILIKIEACGVCHSQLHGIEGDWKDLGIPPVLPTVPGHEVVGKIVEIGKNVTKFKVGDRAGITPLLEACKECQYCKEGKEYLCESSVITGESLVCGSFVLCRHNSLQGSKGSRTTISQKNWYFWHWRSWAHGCSICKN